MNSKIAHLLAVSAGPGGAEKHVWQLPIVQPARELDITGKVTQQELSGISVKMVGQNISRGAERHRAQA